MNDPKKPPQPSMQGLKTRPLDRNIALTKMGVSAGARIAAHEFANLFRGKGSRRQSDRSFYVEQARRLAGELGQLKGSVLKVGQMLSLYGQYFLPPEAVEVLSSLQDDVPPLDWRALEPSLKQALGRQLAELEVDPEPLASASLGQVHRARRLSDGRELVLKIQYPGVAESIESDISTLATLLTVSRMAPRGLNLEPVYAEVKEMLHREVDYLAEMEHTERFAQRLDGDPRYVVPTVFQDYSSDRVLALSYEPGLSAREPEVQRLSQERRNALAHAALELFLRELFEWGAVQTDPHFGNYKIRIGTGGAADRMVLLDFGATRLFGRGFVESYREVLRGALRRDRSLILKGAEGIGLMQRDFPPEIRTAFTELCELIVEPFRGPYDWGASDLPRRVGERIARNALTRYFKIPPREIVFLHRRLSGVFILIATVRAKWDARPVLEKFLGS